MAQHDTLDQAVRELREAAVPETLTAEARSAIFRRIAQSPRRSPLALLFPAPWRVALAGALPMLLAATVVWIGQRTPGPEATDGTVRKQGNQVVFQVPEGATVTKSAVPFAFDPQRSVRVDDGTFADAMGGGPRLVFYRIEPVR
jgi:hypothetical protein